MHLRRREDRLAVWLAALIFLLMLGLIVHRADAAEVTWTAPTQRIDGTPLPATEIAGYNLAHSIGGVDQPVTPLPATASSYVLNVTGLLCVKLQTRDTDGQLSDWTPEICKKARPKPPAHGLR